MSRQKERGCAWQEEGVYLKKSRKFAFNTYKCPSGENTVIARSYLAIANGRCLASQRSCYSERVSSDMTDTDGLERINESSQYNVTVVSAGRPPFCFNPC